MLTYASNCRKVLAEFFKIKRGKTMVTFRGRHGYDGKAPLIDGFDVVCGEEVVGFIYPCGGFSRSCPESLVESPYKLTPEDLQVIAEQGAKVRKMPSEYGWIGVG